MFRAIKKFGIPVVAVATITLLIGCGGGEEASSASEPRGTTEPTAVAQATTTGPGGQSTNQAQDSTDGVSSQAGSSSEFSPQDCSAVQALAIGSGLGTAFTGNSFEGQAFSSQAFRSIADKAPSEIKGDLLVIADALEEFFAVLEELNIDISNPASFASMTQADLERLEAAAGQLDTDEVKAATDNIDAYFSERCN